IISPLFLRQFFNLLSTPSSGGATPSDLLFVIFLFGLSSFLGWLMRRIQVLSLMYVEWNGMTDIFDSTFRYLIRHSHHFFSSNFAGSLTHKVTKFSRAFEAILDSIMLQFFPATLFVVGVLVVLYNRNPPLAGIMALWVLGFVMFQLLMARLRQPVRIARAAADSANTAALADAIGNHATIQLFAGASHEQQRFLRTVEQWRLATKRSWITDEIVWGVQGLLMIGINVGLLYGALQYWRQGRLTVGDFVLIQVYLFGTFDRLLNINRELRRFYDMFADAGEMIEILRMPHDIRDKAGARPLEISAGEIALDDITFRFQPGNPVLRNFHLRIQPAEKVALLGPSGSGKSTVTKLLLRLYDVSDGAIRIDGQNLADVTQDSLWNKVGFVPQEPILFHRTLMENIRYGRRDAGDEAILDAARKAHCHEFIAALPDGYHTYVGERGIKLSGGERQRVAIARAILKDAPILILDEATSNLDSESEALIQDALEVLMRGKTVVVIAHRLSTIMKMDRIIVVEDGRVVAEGTHQSLIQQGGLYRKLWSIQAGGFLDDVAANPEMAIEETLNADAEQVEER
ncbi:MAG TPA: ABC transporter ATP-binding protein, partial [Terriglobia bacterium]|nr:ABC transporter ATP-binding protein [Terriglobia bacterium]